MNLGCAREIERGTEEFVIERWELWLDELWPGPGEGLVTRKTSAASETNTMTRRMPATVALFKYMPIRAPSYLKVPRLWSLGSTRPDRSFVIAGLLESFKTSRRFVEIDGRG